MKAESGKDLLFIAYVVIVIILALIYFTVPERKEFIEFQTGWWRELFESLRSCFK